MPRPRTFEGLRKPKMINILIPGLAAATGRKSDRLRVSSGVYEREAYENRIAMYRDLGRRMLFDLLAARLDGRIRTTDTLYTAYRQGEKELKALLEEHQGQPIAPLLKQFKKEYRQVDRDRTFARLQRFIDAHGGKACTTAAFTDAHVAAFLADLTDERVNEEGRPVSAATRNRYRAAIGVFCTWLVQRGKLIEHPIAFKKVKKELEADARIPAPFEPDEYRTYFEAIEGYRPDYVVVFRMLIHTGGDVGEVFSRTVRDVDLTRKLVHYKRTKTRTPRRVVPFDDELAAELRGHIAAWSLKPSERVFGMFTTRVLETAHRHAAQAVKRPELRIKDLRHFAAIAWVQAGVELPVVKDYLGHATLSQTQVYAAWAPKDEHHHQNAAKAAEQMRGPEGVIPLQRRKHAGE